MYVISISFGTGNVGWSFMYKTMETASAQADRISYKDGDINLFSDDFGQMASIRGSTINGAMVEDTNQSKVAHKERALHEMRIRAAIQNEALSDPALRAAMRAQAGSPAVLQPSGLFNGG